MREGIDVVLCADVVYAPELYEPLLSTLRDLTLRPSAEGRVVTVLMAHRTRHPDEHRPFFEAAALDFKICSLHGSPLPFPPRIVSGTACERTAPGSVGDDTHTSEWRGDVRLLRFQRL